LKYSLDENDEKDIVNTEVIDEDKVASPLTPPTSVNE
jgi:ATP-dependent Clp protease ATP-binding subunit ClpC